MWYPGHVVALRFDAKGDTVDIHYDDGDREFNVPISRVRKLSLDVSCKRSRRKRSKRKANSHAVPTVSKVLSRRTSPWSFLKQSVVHVFGGDTHSPSNHFRILEKLTRAQRLAMLPGLATVGPSLCVRLRSQLFSSPGGARAYGPATEDSDSQLDGVKWMQGEALILESRRATNGTAHAERKKDMTMNVAGLSTPDGISPASVIQSTRSRCDEWAESPRVWIILDAVPVLSGSAQCTTTLSQNGNNAFWIRAQVLASPLNMGARAMVPTAGPRNTKSRSKTATVDYSGGRATASQLANVPGKKARHASLSSFETLLWHWTRLDKLRQLKIEHDQSLQESMSAWSVNESVKSWGRSVCVWLFFFFAGADADAAGLTSYILT